MSWTDIQDKFKADNGVPTRSSMEAADKLRKAGEFPKLPLPLTQMLAHVRKQKPPSFPPISRDTYEYTPLPTATSIRLLRIHGEDRYGFLHCSIRTVDLSEEVLYNCLSYTWGNPFPDSDFCRDSFEKHHSERQLPIACNGKTLYVRQNLYDALRQVPRNTFPFEREHGSKTTVLHRNAAAGVEALVFAALLYSANVDSVDAKGRTALHYAAENGHLEIARTLIDQGVDSACLDYEDRSALDYAEDSGHLDLANLLHEAGKEAKAAPPLHGAPTVTELWVDALCINQNDSAERSQQVAIMNKIYKNARIVCTWLGPADKWTARACRTLARLARHVEQFDKSKLVPFEDNSKEAFEAAKVPFIGREDWTALALLFMRPYFRRCWVLQEIVQAGEVVMFCGSHEILFDDLGVVTEALWNRDRAAHYPSVKYLGSIMQQSGRKTTGSLQIGLKQDYVHSVVWHMYMLVKLKCRYILDQREINGFVEFEGSNVSFSFASLVKYAWMLACTEKHDKIYSLLSLINGGPQVAGIEPNYQIPVERLYAKTTKQILIEHGNLNHLSTMNDRSVCNLPDLPSWVPDYSILGHSVMYNSLYNACGNAESWPETRSSSEWNVFSVRGIRVDTIDAIGRTNEGMATQLHHDPAWFEILSDLDTPYRTGETRGEVLFRTLCMDTESIDEHAKLRFRELVMAMICGEAESEDTADRVRSILLARILSVSATANEDPEKAGQLTSFPAPDPGLEGPYYAHLRPSITLMAQLASSEPDSGWLPTLAELERFRVESRWRLWRSHRSSIPNIPKDAQVFHAVAGRLVRRRLFNTKGRLLGLGSASLEAGDEVWILADAAMPYVLRPSGNGRYRLVAAAYVHGIMHGEAVMGGEQGIEYVELE